MKILWDLTKDILRELNKIMDQLPRNMGITGRIISGIAGLVDRLQGRKKRVSPLISEREAFEEDVRSQFLKLKEKGLSIPVFTL